MSRMVRGSDLVNSTPNVTGEIWPTVDDLSDYILTNGQFGLDIPGTVPRSVGDALADVISVKDFGAVGDGVTDDTAAFNAASAYIRSLINGPIDGLFYIDACLIVPPGKYSVSSWNLTGLLGRSVCINGWGASIIGRTAGKAVIDALGSRWLRFNGLKVRGVSGAVPAVGIQLGPAGTETIGNNTFSSVEVTGVFSQAAFLNAGSETTQHFGCTYLNRSTTAPYAFMADGLTQYVPVSDYITVTRTLGQALSFTNNAHYSTQFRHEGGGDAVFLSASAGWMFDRACYFLSYNAAGFVMYGTSAWRNQDVHIEGLFETNFDNQPTPGNLGIRHCFRFDGDGTNTAIEGFRVKTATPHVEFGVFAIGTSGPVRLSDCHVVIQSLLNAGAKFFVGTPALTLHGSIETRQASKLNLNDITEFTGDLLVDDFSAMGKPVAGSFQAYDTSTKRQYLSGDPSADGSRIRLWNGLLQFDGTASDVIAKVRAKGLGNVELGCDTKSNTLTVVTGAAATTGVEVVGRSTFSSVRASGTNVDLEVAGSGTGLVRIGTFTANADAPVNGYITVKDAAGNTRKLATIA